MSVEVPEMDELLRLAPTARYGDWTPGPGESPASGEDASEGPQGEPRPSRGGALHLSSVLPAVSAAIGHPVTTRIHDDPKALQRALGLPDARSAIVVLVDGLGYWNLNMRLGHAPYLRALMRDHANRRPISTCAPSTTVAAMAVFGTGTCPGLTGMAGYTQIAPDGGRLVQLIQFKDPLVSKPAGPASASEPIVDPHDLQREPTVFERLVDQGVPVTSSGLAKFKGSPLTEAALRGGRYVANVTPRDRVRAAAKSVADKPGLSYLYIRDADKIGHNHGWDSDQWIGTFERIDAQLAQLRREAPKDTLIVIVADHGMVMSDENHRIDIAAEPELSRGVRFVGGEPRALMLYAQDGENPDDVAGRWRDRLGEDALVRTKEEAIADGLFGPVDPRVEAMLGDVIVQASGRTTLVDTRTQSDKATRLPSVHGSQTMLEMDIPCIIDMA
ncbi:alkaline phosphatase family protein [Bifidobacterium platyrrhinorum]|uniref:Nucleotide pyrophosphatase n=1 Tax=Bifidobacterium platyrrhinorum TaxID=2661628 RepID=A0A6L9SSM1_9BIFI|nr:alkaline phosphatase family protein [Bifidobacterium platyrrhinorum]NEG54502.1 nucleotide pyrophosphatase [Bifidobacterium platyrrhinorum]